METHCTGVFSRAAGNPPVTARLYPGYARICSNGVPGNTAVLHIGCRSWHRSSFFEEEDPRCRLSLSPSGRSSHTDQKKCAWDGINRLQRSRNFMEIISYSARHAVRPYGLRILLQFSKTGCWFPLSSFIFMRIIQNKLLLLRAYLIQLIKKLKSWKNRHVLLDLIPAG